MKVIDIVYSQDISASIIIPQADMLTVIGQYLNSLDRYIRLRLIQYVNRSEAPNSNINQQNVLSPKYQLTEFEGKVGFFQ